MGDRSCDPWIGSLACYQRHYRRFSIYSKIPILRPPFGLPKSGLISEVVLILNTITYGKYDLGLAKTGLNSEVVLILSGLNSEILLYMNNMKLIYKSKIQY